jgi:hypothetical protein
MDIVNQHNVWVFGIVAGCGTIGSCIIAFIVNRDKLWEFAQKYWWLISLPFVFLGAWSIYVFVVLGWVWHGLVNIVTVGIPIWVILAAVCVVIGVWFVWSWIAKQVNAEIAGQPRQSSPEYYREEDYIEDLIDGVRWHWNYISGSTSITVGIPKPTCPNSNCQCDLSFREDWNRVYDSPNIARMGRPPVSLHCPRCGFKMDYDQPERGVLHAVSQEILSRLRTKRFREILHNRAMNKRASDN